MNTNTMNPCLDEDIFNKMVGNWIYHHRKKAGYRCHPVYPVRAFCGGSADMLQALSSCVRLCRVTSAAARRGFCLSTGERPHRCRHANRSVRKASVGPAVRYTA